MAATVLNVSSQTMPLNSERRPNGEDMGFDPRISDSKTHVLKVQGQCILFISTQQKLTCGQLRVQSGKKGWAEYVWMHLGKIFKVKCFPVDHVEQVLEFGIERGWIFFFSQFCHYHGRCKQLS